MISMMTSRFDGCCDGNLLKEKISVRPQPLEGLEQLGELLAAERLADGLKEIFIPNPFTVDFIMEVVGRASTYSAEKFDTEAHYLSSVYNPPEAEVFPICLTGLAGVGKSQTIKALRKILPGPVNLTIDHFEGTHTLLSHWYASARGKAGGRQLLADFLGDEVSKSRINASKLLVECRRRVNRDGISLAILEEMQHINTGQGASKVTDLLLTLSGIGIPMVYVANYSLVHKLLSRNSEDKQRLLTEPRIMLPDAPDCEVWKEYIRECVRVSNNRISADTDALADEVYRGTFGIKRLAVQLIKLAYVEARTKGRRKIELEDVHCAYLSTSYSTNRVDVEELNRQVIQKRRQGPRTDLRCPFEAPVKSNVIQFARSDRDDRVISKVFLSSLTAEERLEFKELNPIGTVSNPEPIKRPKRAPIPKPTDEDLANAFNQLLDENPSPPKPKRPS